MVQDRFSNFISAIVNAEDLCSYIKSWNNDITFGIITREIFLYFWSQNFPERFTASSDFSVFM